MKQGLSFRSSGIFAMKQLFPKLQLVIHYHLQSAAFLHIRAALSTQAAPLPVHFFTFGVMLGTSLAQMLKTANAEKCIMWCKWDICLRRSLARKLS